MSTHQVDIFPAFFDKTCAIRFRVFGQKMPIFFGFLHGAVLNGINSPSLALGTWLIRTPLLTLHPR